jgi:hypothetical protein
VCDEWPHCEDVVEWLQDVNLLRDSYADDYDERMTDRILFGEKRCSACGVMVPRCSSYFAVDLSHRDGLSSDCRECRRKRQNRRNDES